MTLELKQLKAMGRRTGLKLTILEQLGNESEGLTYKQIRANEKLKKIKQSTLYDYIRRLRKCELIIRKRKTWPPQYTLSKKGLAFLFNNTYPDVRKTFHGFVKWDSNYIRENLKIFCQENQTTIDIDNVLDHIEQIIKKLNLSTISGQTIRELIAEILYNKGTLEYEKNSYYYEMIGFPLYHIRRYIQQENAAGIHSNFPGENYLKRYGYHLIEYQTLNEIKKNHHIHIHSLENYESIVSITHDIRNIFLNGINANLFRTHPPKNPTSAFSQILTLLDFCNYDGVRTQGIHHFNYFIAPYLEHKSKEEINSYCENFIKTMNRQFIARPRDFICSSISLDIDNKYVDEYKVIKDGKKISEKYSSFEETANKITFGILDEYKSKDYIISPYYPKIIISFSKPEVKELLSNNGLMEKIFTIIKENMQNPIIFHNRSNDTTILSDLTRIELEPNQQKMQSVGCISATSLLNIDIEDRKSFQDPVKSHINQIIRIVRDLGLQKQQLIEEKITNNQCQILGRPRRAYNLRYLFNYEHPLVCMRMFNLKNIFQKLFRDESNIFDKVLDFISYVADELETPRSSHIAPVLGQTSSSSEAISRAVQINQDNLDFEIDRYGLYSSVKTKKIDSQLQNDAKLQRCVKGGMLSTIKIDINDFSLKELNHYINKCNDNNIEFFNFIDADLNKPKG